MIYRPEIDGLRAIAVVPVILFHAGFDSFGGGFVGVDVFFVISGYLITSIILSDIAADKFSLAGFYERRVRRILPALFAVMLVCIPFGWAFLLPNDMKDFAQSVAAVATFSSNILFWMESGYFDTAAELKPLLHTWSLSVEEQYYILFPLFLLLIWRLGTPWLVITLTLFFLLSLALAQWGAYKYPAATFYLLPTRGWEILIGALVALYLFRRKSGCNHSGVRQCLSLAGLSLILYSILVFSERTPFPSLFALVPTIGTALVVLFGVKGTLVNAILGKKFFVGVGLISYSAYLWHQPLFAFARYRSLTEPSDVLMAVLCLVTLPLAYLSWLYVEKPFRRNGRFSRQFVFASCILLGIAFVSFGLFGHKLDGYATQRFTEAEMVLLQSAEMEMSPVCEDINSMCGYSSMSDYDVLLLGDSNAFHFSEVLEEILQEADGRVLNLTRGGCLPLSPFIRMDSSAAFNRACDEMNDGLNELIATSLQLPKTVMVSAAWSLYYYGPGYYEGVAGNRTRIGDAVLGTREGLSDEALSQGQVAVLFDSYLRELSEKLRRYFERVVIIAPLPPLLIELERQALLEEPPGSALREFESQNRELLDLFGKLDDIERVQIFYPHEVLCRAYGQQRCLTVHDGKHLYSDNIHVSGYGQRYVFSSFFQSLANGD